MGSYDAAPLITLGPFIGVQTSPQGPYVSEGCAQSASNCDPNRYPGSLTVARGRTQLANLNILGTGSTATAVVPYIPNVSDEWIVVQNLKGGSYATTLYTYSGGSQSYIQYGSGTDNAQFDQGLQVGAFLYLNSGRQYFGFNTFLWQYPAPNGTSQAYSVTATTSGALPAQTYYYAFTQVVQDPYASGATNNHFGQETTPTGNNFLAGSTYPNNYTYTATLNAPGSVQISGTFSGTNTDGSLYTTNVYRQSIGQPVWYLLTTLTTNGTYTDTTPDATIASNAQLVAYRDPPPISGQLPAVFSHKERAWVFTIVNTTQTTASGTTVTLPQAQLWFSSYGRPWEFDSVNSVLLVGNSNTPPGNPIWSSAAYGDVPVAGASLSSVGILWKTRTLWILYGDDPTSFLVRKIADIGLKARASIVQGPLGQTYAYFWLSEHGVMTFDGSSLTRIDDDIRATIRSLSETDRVQAVGMYANLTYYLSFPNAGVTWCFYTPSGKWYPIPYATNAAFSTPANPPTYTATQGINEVVAVRPGTNYVDSWFAGNDLDLGAPQTGTWTSPATGCGDPAAAKEFTYVIVFAPIQPNVIATPTLNIDGNAIPLPPFNLGTTTRNIVEIPSIGQQNWGYLASLTLTLTTVTPSTTPAIIYQAAVYGFMRERLALPQ